MPWHLRSTWKGTKDTTRRFYLIGSRAALKSLGVSQISRGTVSVRGMTFDPVAHATDAAQRRPLQTLVLRPTVRIITKTAVRLLGGTSDE